MHVYPRSDFEEVLWFFSRPGNEKISLRSNAHFYRWTSRGKKLDGHFPEPDYLPLAPAAGSDKFTEYLVLLDREGHISLDCEDFPRFFGNVWQLDQNRLLLKGMPAGQFKR